ncbi:MAG: FIST N-terminal domain-containing protein, partial [Vulcanimicrobiaceae bacterium]
MDTLSSRPDAIRTAVSHARDAERAASEVFDALGRPADGLTVFFCSPFYDLAALGDALRERFAGADVIGCTTAGEISSAGYLDNALVAVWFPGSAFECVTEHVENLQLSSISHVHDMVRALKRRRRDLRDDDRRTFALCLIDGITGFEELVVAALREGLGEIPLAGGS